MAKETEGLRAALDELEALIIAAERDGTPVDPWIEQVALELRSSLARDQSESVAEVAGLIRSEPVRSLGAQSRLAAAALSILKS